MHQRETAPEPRSKPPARSAIIRSGKKNSPPQRETSSRDVRSPPADALKRTDDLPVPNEAATIRPSPAPSSSLPPGQKRRRTTDDRTGKIAPGHRPARDGAHPTVMARRNTKRPSATWQRSRQRTASPHGKRCPRPVARQKKPDAPNEKGARSDSGHLRTGFHAAISAVFPYTCRSVS